MKAVSQFPLAPPLVPADASRAVARQRVRHWLTTEDWAMRLLLVGSALWLLIAVILPLLQVISRSLVDASGQQVGLANYRTYFTSPALFVSFQNSMTVAILTTFIAVGLAFAYAYCINRTQVRGKTVFRVIALLPLFAPSLAIAIALIYLFGNKGIITTGFWGYPETLLGVNPAFNIQIYGLTGILLGEIFFCFPQAFLIMTIALTIADARLYEASTALRATPLRTFFAVTLPTVKYGLISACFVCFTLAFTDFGVPQVVGGRYNVLATDIYKQVIGQQNFVMGATISVLLLVPTAIAFVLDRIVQRRQAALITSRTVPYRPRANPLADRVAFGFCLAIALAIVIPLLTIILASLVDVWPYRLGLTLKHYNFSLVGGGGYGAYWNSLRMAFYTAICGTLLTFGSAYLIEKGRGVSWLRGGLYFCSIMPIALPGMVIGLAYIFFFNPRGWTLGGLYIPNPLNFIYGTMIILVMSCVVHFYTVGFLTATTALKQLDAEFEATSMSMAVPFYRTFLRVTAPLCLPAILEVAVYYFVSAMVTVSAVIFLYSPQTKLASVAIVNMDDAGDTASAAAMSVILIMTSIGVRLLYGLLTRQLQKWTQTWRTA